MRSFYLSSEGLVLCLLASRLKVKQRVIVSENEILLGTLCRAGLYWGRFIYGKKEGWVWMGMQEREEKCLCAVQGQGFVGQCCNPTSPCLRGNWTSSSDSARVSPLLCRFHFGSIPDHSLVTLSDFPFTTAASQEHPSSYTLIAFHNYSFSVTAKLSTVAERLGTH